MIRSTRRTTENDRNQSPRAMNSRLISKRKNNCMRSIIYSGSPCLVGALLLIITFAGCGLKRGEGVLGVDEKATIPSGALPAAVGDKVCAWHQAQSASAAFDKQVFYLADFVGNTAQIAPAAYRQFAARVGGGSPEGTVPVVLEPSGQLELDQQRIAELTNMASHLGLSSIQVQLGHSPALGLIGPDAERIGRSTTNTGGSNQGGARASGRQNVGGIF